MHHSIEMFYQSTNMFIIVLIIVFVIVNKMYLNQLFTLFILSFSPGGTRVDR